MQTRPTRKKTKRPAELDMTSDAITELFPHVRYFQIHYEYLHELLNHAIVKIDALNTQVTQLEKRLANSNDSESTKRRAAVDSFTISHNSRKDGKSSLTNSSRTL